MQTPINWLIRAAMILAMTVPVAVFAQRQPNSAATRAATATTAAATTAATDPTADREFWLTQLDRIARPVLSNLAHDELKKNMLLVLSERTDNREERTRAAYLEAFGRMMSGIAPWLGSEGGSPKEIALRQQYREWVIPAIAHAVDPAAKDYLSWQRPGQALVDAAFFAFGLVRCPWIWEHLDDSTRSRVAEALRSTRLIKPGFSNWLLFSGMIETFFCKYGMPWDEMRVDYCIRQHQQWYVGDGLYSDGPSYHWDYYNSYVIHPFLAAIVATVSQKTNAYRSMTATLLARDQRYAIIQERLINADGSYPANGRSIVYRGAAFHHLADMAWRKELPASLKPAQVRCALTAVLKKTLENPAVFTKDGWLNIGLYGAQPGLAESYITTGSLYICADILLPLGLPADDPFWTAPAEPWTAKKIWTGQDAAADHASD